MILYFFVSPASAYYPGFQRPLEKQKNGTSGSATTRPCSNNSCQTTEMKTFLYDSDNEIISEKQLQGDQIINEKQRTLILRA